MALVLIVDDEEMDRVLERAILEKAGHELLFANDGESAMKLCRKEDLDLIITDLAMPNFNGLRFIKELREEGLMTPVIAVSGWATDQLDLAIEYGADLSMEKPLDGVNLQKAVETALAIGHEVGRRDPWKRVIK
ncbi:MAG: response regulator [Gemmatimonadetes bacterium]|nr:response regulator [Gemmatimonadota bacterium]